MGHGQNLGVAPCLEGCSEGGLCTLFRPVLLLLLVQGCCEGLPALDTLGLPSALETPTGRQTRS